MGCSLEERHLLKVDPERALSMTSRWEIDRSRNSPGWIARGCHFQAQLSACSTVTWINGAIQRIFSVKCCGERNSVVFLLHPWLKQWSDLVSYQVLSSRLILFPCGPVAWCRGIAANVDPGWPQPSYFCWHFAPIRLSPSALLGRIECATPEIKRSIFDQDYLIILKLFNTPQNKTMFIISYPERSPLSTQGSHLVFQVSQKWDAGTMRYMGILRLLHLLHVLHDVLHINTPFVKSNYECFLLALRPRFLPRGSMMTRRREDQGVNKFASRKPNFCGFFS